VSFFPDSADEYLRRARGAALEGAIQLALDLLKASSARFAEDLRARELLRDAGLDLRFQREGLSGHAATVDNAAITEDGTIAATGSARDGTVRVWDVTSGAQLLMHTRARRRSDAFEAMALHPSGRILTIASGDGFVERIDTATGQTLWRHAIDPKGFETCALSKSGAWLACAQGTKLEVFDTVTGARLTSVDDASFHDPTDRKAELRPFVFDYDDDDDSGPKPRQTRIKDIAVSEDGKATPLFDRPARKKLVFDPPQRSFPSMIARGKTAIAIGRYEGSVEIWSDDGELLRSLPAPAKGGHREILSVAVNDADEVAVGRYDRSIQTFPARGGEPRVVIESGTRSIIGIRALAWSPDGSLLVGLGDDGIARWVRKDGTKGTFAENDGAACLAIAFQPSGSFFATSSCSGDARIWRSKDHAPLQQFPKQGRPAALAYSPSGEVLAVAADDTLRSLPIGRTIARVPSGDIGVVAWVDDDRVATGGSDGNVYVFDARKFGPARTVLDGHSGSIETIIAIDRKELLTGARDGMVAHWNLEAIEPHGSFTQALREVLRVYA
jgi:WD40 repeat protein